MAKILKGFMLTLFIVVAGFALAGCDEVALEGIEIEGVPTETIVVGQTFELRAVFDPTNATDQRVDWWTPNNDIIDMQVLSSTIVSIETIGIGTAVVYARAYDGNFTDSVTLQVEAGALSLRFQGSVNGVVTRDYNGEPQQMQVVGIEENVTYLYRLQEQTEYTTQAPTDVGTYDIRAEVNSPNFTGSTDAVLQILPQEIRVEANNREVYYGDDEVALTYRIIGNFYDNAPSISGGLQREQGTDAGNYRIYESEPFTLTGENSSNYEVVFVEGNYSIQPISAQVQVSAPNTYYGTEVGEITYTVQGLINDDTVEGLGIQIVVPENARDVGLYTLKCTYTNKNYNLQFNNNTLNIVRTPITITVGSKDKKYGTADPEDISYTIYNSRNEDTTKLFYDDVLSMEFERTAGEDVGQYDINALVSGERVVNYRVTVQKGKLTINARNITVQAQDASKRYGQSDPEFAYTIVEGSDEILNNELTFEFTREQGENVGQYAITPNAVQEKANYQVQAIDGTLNITQALVTLQVLDATKIYADADPQFEFTVAPNSDALQQNHALGLKFERVSGEDVGEYQVNLIVETADPNYQVSTLSGTLEIIARHLIFDVGNLTMRYYQGYDVGDVQFSLNAGSDANVESIDIAQSVNIEVPYQNNVGSYPLIVTLKQEIPNYNVEFVGGNLIIEQAQVIIKLKDTQVYYGIEPTFEFEYVQNSDTMGDTLDGADEFTFTVPSEYYEVLDADTYQILGQVSQPNNNYNITVLAGTLTINKAQIYATVLDNVITYGQQPDMQYQITQVDGQLFEDEVEFAFEGMGTDVGEYPVTLVLNKGTENYRLFATAGTLTINQANITINVHAKSFKYGEDASVAFTYDIQVSGNDVTSDKAQSELSITLRGEGQQEGEYQAVGTYDIICEYVEINEKHNYNITVNEAQYQINKRQYIFKIVDKQIFEGEEIGEFTCVLAENSDALLPEDANIADTIMFEEVTQTTAGRYTISGSAPDSDHYEITVLDGTLTILDNQESDI